MDLAALYAASSLFSSSEHKDGDKKHAKARTDKDGNRTGSGGAGESRMGEADAELGKPSDSFKHERWLTNAQVLSMRVPAWREPLVLVRKQDSVRTLVGVRATCPLLPTSSLV